MVAKNKNNEKKIKRVCDFKLLQYTVKARGLQCRALLKYKQC